MDQPCWDRARQHQLKSQRTSQRVARSGATPTAGELAQAQLSHHLDPSHPGKSIEGDSPTWSRRDVAQPFTGAQDDIPGGSDNVQRTQVDRLGFPVLLAHTCAHAQY
jgi:hypothetical protein